MSKKDAIETSDMDDFNFSLDDDSTDNAAPSVPASQPDAQNALARRHTSLLSRIPVTLTLEVASVEIALSELLRIDDDSVIELDKLAGEPLDIKVNGILFGKAEVVVLNEKYGIRVLEFNSKEIDELAL
ncbi:flagellar motor switch protein FliN [Ewingella sp. CoE-038-23]